MIKLISVEACYGFFPSMHFIMMLSQWIAEVFKKGILCRLSVNTSGI